MERNFLQVFCLTVALLSNGILEGSAIINGEIANPADFKYLVTFWNATMHLCGGAILDDWHVITSAHCVFLEDKTFHTAAISLIAGAANFNVSTNSTFSTTVEKFYVTDRFNQSDWLFYNAPEDDIAVLKVRDKFNLQENPNLAAVQLPVVFTDADSYTHKTVRHAGYGFQTFKASKINNTLYNFTGSATGQLYETSLFINERWKCIEDYRKYLQFMKDWTSTNSTKEIVDFPEIIIPPTSIDSDIISIPDDELIRTYQICCHMTAHGLNSSVKQGLCDGDGGNPLVDKNTVIGVSSFGGFDCNDRGLPNIFTMVTYYLDFVWNAMNDNVAEGMRVSPILPAEYVPVPPLNQTIYVQN